MPTNPCKFISELRDLAFPNAFNPYAQRCEIHDRPNAPKIRAETLRKIVTAASDVDLDDIWIGRDLGHRGGRRTGLALTDDMQFFRHTKKWGVEAERPTFGPLLKERTATAVWEMVGQINRHVFLWNIFPLHPYSESSDYCNRPHNVAERDSGLQLLGMLIAMLRPRRIVAIGNDAAHALKGKNGTLEVHHVRHPSYGGENLFRAQVASLYALSSSRH